MIEIRTENKDYIKNNKLKVFLEEKGLIDRFVKEVNRYINSKGSVWNDAHWNSFEVGSIEEYFDRYELYSGAISMAFDWEEEDAYHSDYGGEFWSVASAKWEMEF